MDDKIGSGIRRRSRPVTKLGVTTKFKRNKIAMFLVIFIVIILVLVSVYMVFSNFENDDSDKNDSSMLSDEEKIIGIWKYTETYEGQTIIGIFTFLEDKTVEYSQALSGGTPQTLIGSWDITGNKLVLSFEGVEIETTDYVFSDDNEKLTLTDDGGITRVLTRQ
jgi:hypothetical protein